MIKLYDSAVYAVNGRELVPADEMTDARLQQLGVKDQDEARRNTMTWSILESHNHSDNMDSLKIKFDSMTSHDITYVGIIQTARASGMEKFPLPYVMTNCHNSLCAVGGTINEDDHKFALSAAKKYGGIYVPTNLAVIHSFNREMMAGGGKMILGSDSHTRYGALGTMAVGEGGGELAKQLVGRSYDIAYPQVVGIQLTGKPQPGVGPHDVALSIIGAVYENGYVKNKVMEFFGDGLDGLSVEYRNGIDVMTTETTCWSSIWRTDLKVKDYLDMHGRVQDYKEIDQGPVAYYDGMVQVDLSAIEPTIALPFHPSNTYSIRELIDNAGDIFNKVEQDVKKTISAPGLSLNLTSKIHSDGIYVDQGIIVGCSGGIFDNIVAAADIIDGKSIGDGTFTMSVYPGSQPAYMELVRNGTVEKLMEAGVLMRSAFCGPCFGAGDTPANGELSIRHATRNFPNREGSKPSEGQLTGVALMDARSIAATAINGGRLTPATDLDVNYSVPKYYFDKGIYEKRVYNGVGKADSSVELLLGPNIKDWPEMSPLTDDLLIKVVSYITDPVTTTDELIPSGESSSYRSNPLRMAEFTLSRKDPSYVGKAKAVKAMEDSRQGGQNVLETPELKAVYDKIKKIAGFENIDPNAVAIGSSIYAVKPGDGSAREQAASCQRVLSGTANLAKEYATKRYRSNLINWGLIPFLIEDASNFSAGDYIFFPGVRKAILDSADSITGYVIGKDAVTEISTSLGALTDSERQILVDGCLINYYKSAN